MEIDLSANVIDASRNFLIYFVEVAEPVIDRTFDSTVRSNAGSERLIPFSTDMRKLLFDRRRFLLVA